MSNYAQENNKNTRPKNSHSGKSIGTNAVCLNEYKAKKLKAENRQALANIMKSAEELDW